MHHFLYKAYLIKESSENQDGNEYAPFYIWNSKEGMNRFLFDGFYDNILASFGWQHIHIGVPLLCELKDTFPNSHYVYEIKHSISPLQHMQRMQFSLSDNNSTGRVLIYNPDLWQYTAFYFYESKQTKSHEGQRYEILHISLSK